MYACSLVCGLELLVLIWVAALHGRRKETEIEGVPQKLNIHEGVRCKCNLTTWASTIMVQT